MEGVVLSVQVSVLTLSLPIDVNFCWRDPYSHKIYYQALILCTAFSAPLTWLSSGQVFCSFQGFNLLVFLLVLKGFVYVCIFSLNATLPSNKDALFPAGQSPLTGNKVASSQSVCFM